MIIRRFIISWHTGTIIFNYFPGVRSPGAFPAHQPVLDTPKLKADYSSYMTSSMEYGSSRIGKPKSATE